MVVAVLAVWAVLTRGRRAPGPAMQAGASIVERADVHPNPHVPRGTLRATHAPSVAADSASPAARRRSVTSLRLVDFVTGQPIAGGLVHARGDSETHVADERGCVELPLELRAALELEATADGYCVARGRIDLTRDERKDVLLVPSSPLEGRVLDAAGEPVPRALVHLFLAADTPAADSVPRGYPEGWRLFGEREDVTLAADDDGRFRMPGLAPLSTAHVLRAWRPGYVPTVRDVVARGAGQTTWIELRLEPEPVGTLRGAVTLNGEPIQAGVKVLDRSRAIVVHSDEEGRFVVEQIAPGPITVGAWPLRWREVPEALAGGSHELELGPAAEPWLDVRLTIELGAIAGRILGPHRLDASELLVRAFGREVSLWVAPDAEGRYSIEVPVSCAPYQLVLEGTVGTFTRADVRVPSSDVDFRLPELAELRVRVRDARTGEELRGYRVLQRRVGEVGWDEGQVVRTATPEGAPVAALPEPIDVRIVRAKYAAVEVADVQLAPGRSLALEVEMYPR